MKATNGVYLNDHFTGTTGKAVVINADSDASGTGTFTMKTDKTLTSSNSDVVITAYDVDVAGSVAAGSGAISVHGAEPVQTIGLGGTAANMHITAAREASAARGAVVASRTGAAVESEKRGLSALRAQKEAARLQFELSKSLPKIPRFPPKI